MTYIYGSYYVVVNPPQTRRTNASYRGTA